MGNMTLHAEGNPVCSFVNSAKTPIESLKAYFAPTQSGSGDPSPSNVRPIEGWTGLSVYKDDVYLPVEYQRVEWIKSDGGQYIDTGILFNHGIKVIAKMGFVEKSNSKTLFGIRLSPDAERFLVAYYRGIDFAYWTDEFWIEPNVDMIYTFIFDTTKPGKFTYGLLDNLRTRNVTEMYSNTTGYIFAYHRKSDNSVQGVSKSYFESMIIENSSGVKLFEGYACYRKSDLKPGIYDKVTNTFLTNSGTGEFLYGPVCGETIPVTFPVLGKNKFNKAAPYKELEGATNKITSKQDLIAGLNAGQMIFYGLGHASQINEEIVYDVNNQLNIILDVIPNKTYCCIGSIDGGTRNQSFIKQLDFLDKNFLTIARNVTHSNGVFTVSNNTNIKYAYIYVHNYAQSATQNPWSASDVLNTLQIEFGDAPTTYEPYNPDNTVYGGYVDLVKGEVVQTWTTRPISELTVTKSSGSGVWQHRFHLRPPWITGIGYEDAGNAYEAVCSCFMFGSAETNFTFLTYSGLICVYDDTTETAEDFQTKYGNYNVAYQIRQALYKTYPLSPTALNALRGQNYIWSNASNKIEVDYDLHETRAIQQAKRRIAANEPHVAIASGAIATFNTNMKAPMKSCKVGFLPVQEGTGDPSPENVRAISGWTGLSATNNGTTIPIDWTSEAGTIYGGYVDLVTGEVWKTHHKIVADGASTNCKFNRDYSNDTYIISGIVYLSPTGASDNQYGISKLYCDKIPLKTPSGSAINVLPYFMTISSGAQYLRMVTALVADHPELDTSQKRIDFCNDYLINNPITIVYPLATPELVATLTPTQLKTLVGTNNIWSNANGTIETKYWKH